MCVCIYIYMGVWCLVVTSPRRRLCRTWYTVGDQWDLPLSCDQPETLTQSHELDPRVDSPVGI